MALLKEAFKIKHRWYLNWLLIQKLNGYYVNICIFGFQQIKHCFCYFGGLGNLNKRFIS